MRHLRFLAGLVLAAFALFDGSAQAQTVNLGAAGCNAYCACGAVPNDGGLDISQTTWYWAYAGVPYILDMTIDGVHYTAADRGGDPATGVWLYGPSGEQRLATIQFRRLSTKGGSGRGGGYYVQHCAITGGTLQ